MAIYHCSMKPISRASGRSAVASAAYRSGECLTNERDGLTHDYTHKAGIEHREIVLPNDISADWACDRSSLWNAAERAEKRKDARVAREFEIALPHELTAEARLEAVRSFAQDLADRTGAAVDFAIHAPGEGGDIRNHHAHVMMTTRRVGPEGLDEKTCLERENKWLLSQGLATTDIQLRDIRRSWEGIANERLAAAGLDIRIDHRSHMERGLELAPTEHMGVHATQMHRRDLSVERGRLSAEAAERNAVLIREKPEEVLTLITGERSVFDRHDIARVLHRYVNDDVQAFQNAFASVMRSPALVELQNERVDAATGEISLARYSTREMVTIERGLADTAERLHEARGHGVDRQYVLGAMERQDQAIQRASGDPLAALSDEQRGAIEHITGRERIAAVVGFAGAGKSTMLAAAREAWEAQGYTVHGAALSGKAAEGLEESSGIASRTLASWTYGWDRERGLLGQNDVFVIDEAGMVSSRQLARFVSEAEARGAKLVLVGDHEQLQAIGAGAPFRAVAERIGHAELSDIRRQREDWQREASRAFATHRTAEGLAAYREHGAIQLAATRDEARGAIVRDYLADEQDRPDGTRVAMAHRRVDVRALNEDIRTALQDGGRLGRGEEGGELAFAINDGERRFAPGDRIVFLENDRDLGVKNGMLGTVEAVEPGRIQARLDGASRDPGQDRFVTIDTESYRAVDHGYATTIHKTQGATVDRAFVLASGTMDRHLTYVAMTRHRDEVRLYADIGEFADKRAGTLVAHGRAPFEHQAGNRDSYHVTLEAPSGERRTVWGVGLERAMAEAKPAIGATIALDRTQSEPVRLPDGTEGQRQTWRVRSADEIVHAGLESRLSRSGAKETVLDYDRDASLGAAVEARAFAERRGIAEAFGIRSEIEVPRERVEERIALEVTAERDRQQQRRDPFEGVRIEASGRDRTEAAPDRIESVERPRRSMFDGLRLQTTSASRERGGREGSALDRLAERVRPLSSFERAVDGYARALSAIERQLREGLPLLDGQRRELDAAGQRLDQARPGSHALIRSALEYDPQMTQAMSRLAGRERVDGLVAGMDRERAALADPNVRAERFVERWRNLAEQRQALSGWQHDKARSEVEARMQAMGHSLERDPQVESILQNRHRDLGISPHGRGGEGIARDLERSVQRGRGYGMER